MTKTKKQLRAEAVERLKMLNEYGGGSFEYAILGSDKITWRYMDKRDALIDLLTDDDSTISEIESTTEWGMTNLEWLYEHDEYLNSFAKLIACLRGFSTDEFTANEWLRQEHSEPNPDCSAMLYKTFTGNMCSHYEPKDGVVAILREAARNLSDYHDAGEALRRLTDTLNVYHALETLADMIERDYVRRESIEEVMDNDRALVEENSMLARELLKLRAELEKATNNLNSANKDFENARAELVAERDELQEQLNRTTSAMNRAAGKWAKAESRSAKRAAAVERLRQLPPMNTSDMRYVRAMLGSVAGMTAQDVVAELIELLEDDELTAELDAAKQQIIQFVAPKSVETSENPASKCEIRDFDDSREKLEADVLAYLTPHEIAARLLDNAIFGWLDRQEAITKREWCDEQGFWNCAEDAVMLSAQVVQLTAERDNLADDLLIANKQREYYRDLFGKCLDYADAIHALMDDEGLA